MLSSRQAGNRHSCDLNSFFFRLSTVLWKKIPLNLQDLEFFGVMRFFFQDTTSKVATKCIRVASSATTQDVLDILIEKFRPDMRMLTLPNYSLYEVHANGGASLFQRYKIIIGFFNWSIQLHLQKSESWQTRSDHWLCSSTGARTIAREGFSWRMKIRAKRYVWTL